MTYERRLVRHSREKRSRCEIEHYFGGSSCEEHAQVSVNGLVFCHKHALEVKLEGQVSCWREMLFHIDLWSREAGRRQRQDIMQLLELQRAEAASAMERACLDLDLVRSELEASKYSGQQGPLTAALLRARGVRRLSGEPGGR